MTWLWQPLLPGGAQLLGGAPDLSAEASQAFTIGQTAAAQAILSGTAAQAFAMGQDATATGGTATAQQIGPADDRPARRRRDRQISEAYWAQRQREALEEQERERLEALAEAERALERAEDAKRVDAKRKAVRAVFAALRRAAVTEKARDDAQASEQAALAAIAGRQTEQQRAVYLAALDQLNVEIEAIGAEITRLYARRRQEEEFLLRMWAS